MDPVNSQMNVHKWHGGLGSGCHRKHKPFLAESRLPIPCGRVVIWGGIVLAQALGLPVRNPQSPNKQAASGSTRFMGDELVKNEAISSPNPVQVSGADTLDPLYFGSVIHKDRMIINYIWLVVWNIFYFSIYSIGNSNPNGLTFFRGVETTNQI